MSPARPRFRRRIANRGATAKDQTYAARSYFTLKYFGHDNVALLNGGTAQWVPEGRPLACTEEPVTKGTFVVTGTRRAPPDPEAAESGGAQLVDCRTEDQYLGLTLKRNFVAPEHHLATLKGVDLGAPTIPYCNTGVTASLGWFALHEVLRNDATRLYDGSMHAWSWRPRQMCAGAV